MKLALKSDVSTLDGILHALYEVLSGPVARSRDWERYRSLFMDDARIIVVVAVAGEQPRVRQLSLEDYIRRVEPIFAVEDFWERETSRQTETFGRVAHVLSSTNRCGIRTGRLLRTAPTGMSMNRSSRAEGPALLPCFVVFCLTIM